MPDHAAAGEVAYSRSRPFRSRRCGAKISTSIAPRPQTITIQSPALRRSPSTPPKRLKPAPKTLRAMEEKSNQYRPVRAWLLPAVFMQSTIVGLPWVAPSQLSLGPHERPVLPRWVMNRGRLHGSWVGFTRPRQCSHGLARALAGACQTQVRAVGLACRRAGSIGSRQTWQSPYVPSTTRSSADSTSSRCSRA